MKRVALDRVLLLKRARLAFALIFWGSIGVGCVEIDSMLSGPGEFLPRKLADGLDWVPALSLVAYAVCWGIARRFRLDTRSKKITFLFVPLIGLGVGALIGKPMLRQSWRVACENGNDPRGCSRMASVDQERRIFWLEKGLAQEDWSSIIELNQSEYEKYHPIICSMAAARQCPDEVLPLKLKQRFTSCDILVQTCRQARPPGQSPSPPNPSK